MTVGHGVTTGSLVYFLTQGRMPQAIIVVSILEELLIITLQYK